MNTATGEIKNWDELTKEEKDSGLWKKVKPTTIQMKHGFVKRNEKCPCGSGKNFKNCCLTV